MLRCQAIIWHKRSATNGARDGSNEIVGYGRRKCKAATVKMEDDRSVWLTDEPAAAQWSICLPSDVQPRIMWETKDKCVNHLPRSTDAGSICGDTECATPLRPEKNGCNLEFERPARAKGATQYASATDAQN
jgi:hypothetical protein